MKAGHSLRIKFDGDAVPAIEAICHMAPDSECHYQTACDCEVFHDGNDDDGVPGHYAYDDADEPVWHALERCGVCVYVERVANGSEWFGVTGEIIVPMKDADIKWEYGEPRFFLGGE